MEKKLSNPVTVLITPHPHGSVHHRKLLRMKFLMLRYPSVKMYLQVHTYINTSISNWFLFNMYTVTPLWTIFFFNHENWVGDNQFHADKKNTVYMAQMYR